MPGHDVLGAERHLLGLGEEVVDHAVQHQPADTAHRQLLLGDDLGGVEHVEVEAVGEVLVEQLQAQLPLGIVAHLDRVPEIAAMEVGIGAVDLHRLVPDHRLHALLGLPVELDEGRLAVGIDQPEGMDAEAFHEAERARDRAVRHDPHDHVHALGRQRDEVPEIVVRRLRLREAAVRLLLGGVDQVGELDRILDEEDRDVVADQVPVAFLGVELDREAAHVAREVRRALAAGDGREADEDLGLLALALEQVGAGDIGQQLVGLEVAVRPEAPRVHHPLRDALVIEVEDLLAEVEVFEQRSGRARLSSASSGRRRRGCPERW